MPRYLGYSLLILSVSQFLHSEMILHETNFLFSQIIYTVLNNPYLTGKFKIRKLTILNNHNNKLDLSQYLIIISIEDWKPEPILCGITQKFLKFFSVKTSCFFYSLKHPKGKIRKEEKTTIFCNVSYTRNKPFGQRLIYIICFTNS